MGEGGWDSLGIDDDFVSRHDCSDCAIVLDEVGR